MSKVYFPITSIADSGNSTRVVVWFDTEDVTSMEVRKDNPIPDYPPELGECIDFLPAPEPTEIDLKVSQVGFQLGGKPPSLWQAIKNWWQLRKEWAA